MRFEKLDLNLLAALDALLEERSVSAAARRLHLSQPALSGALNRLRQYFGDELLLHTGRRMALTPRAEALRQPVREALMLIRSRITTPREFAPATAERRFVITASEYVFTVLMADIIADAARLAPSVIFEVLAPDRETLDRFERGEIDLVLGVSSQFRQPVRRRRLFDDEHAVICWSGGRYASSLGLEDFFRAGHAIAVFGRDRDPPLTEAYFQHQGINRRIEVELPSFALLPRAVVGTDRIATMYRRHAERYAETLPISLHPCPIALPDVEEAAHWHPRRDDDVGLQWLVEVIGSRAERLSTGAAP